MGKKGSKKAKMKEGKGWKEKYPANRKLIVAKTQMDVAKLIFLIDGLGGTLLSASMNGSQDPNYVVEAVLDAKQSSMLQESMLISPSWKLAKRRDTKAMDEMAREYACKHGSGIFWHSVR